MLNGQLVIKRFLYSNLTDHVDLFILNYCNHIEDIWLSIRSLFYLFLNSTCLFLNHSCTLNLLWMWWVVRLVRYNMIRSMITWFQAYSLVVYIFLPIKILALCIILSLTTSWYWLQISYQYRFYPMETFTRFIDISTSKEISSHLKR